MKDTKPTKKGRTPGPRIAAATFAILAVLAVFPSAGAHTLGALDVNNMGCAHWVMGSKQAKSHGVPFHDVEYRIRTDCSDADEVGLNAFSVTPGTSSHLRAELYLLPLAQGNPRSGQVCLKWEDSPFFPPWTCSGTASSTGQDWPTPDWYWDWHHVSLPFAVVPRSAEYYVGFRESGSSTITPQSSFNYINYYSGAYSPVADIDDPSGDNAYTSMSRFQEWIINDPTGDDLLRIGGVPLKLNPGNEIVFTTHGIRVEYKTSGTGGNEWRITKVDGSEKAFVWHDGSNLWEIKELTY